MINNERVRQARELRGLTQAELASRIGATQATIAHIEGNRFQPIDELVEAIAFQTGFPISFFRQDKNIDFPLGSLLFRARAAMPAAKRASVHRYGQVMFEMAEQMIARVSSIPVRLPILSEDPPTAARMTRASLGLSPNSPIPNLIRTVEKAGVLVLVLPTSMDGWDAYSAWVGVDTRRPVIVISGDAPGDRLRFSVAHELAHLVKHQVPNGTIKHLEKEADQFAAEFLMPEAVMREEITCPVTLTGLVALKPRWKVSLQALIERSYGLGMLTERQHRYLWEQMATRGWKVREPSNLDIPVERPRAVRKMAELLYGMPINYELLATDVHLSTGLVRQIIETHDSQDDLSRSRDENEKKVLSFKKRQ